MANFFAHISPEDRARLDELFSDITDRSGEVAPISADERAARRERLGALLRKRGLDAFVIEPGTTMTYLTGVGWESWERLFALVVTADGELFWICPNFESSRARIMAEEPGGEIVTWEENEYPYAPLAAAFASRRVERVALEPWLRLRFADGIASAHGRERVEVGQDLLVELRGRKDEHEISILRHANEFTQEAICKVARTLEPGATTSEIAMRLTVAQERMGLTGIWNLSLIGPAGAFPHGEDRERTLEDGDVLLVDTGGKLHGYGSDNTRTWAQGGRPSERFSGIWHTVRDAQKAAFEAIRPGAACRTVDEAARAVIDASGYGSGYGVFTHRLGHGIGLDGHEDPYFDGGSSVPMEAGMTFSNEPGIYLPGEFGVRVEDIVAVTEDGADHFGSWQAGPESPDPR